MVNALAFFCVALAVALVDPFGLESDSQNFSADLTQYVTSPLYARGLGGREPVGQDKVSVVYLDQGGLDLLPHWLGISPPTPSRRN